MGSSILFGNAAHQHDGLSNNQFCDTAGIGVGRVKYHYAVFCGCLQIHLIGADAETAHADQPSGRFKYLAVELGAGANPDEVEVPDFFDQLFF